jgi:hypothetical protein
MFEIICAISAVLSVLLAFIGLVACKTGGPDIGINFLVRRIVLTAWVISLFVFMATYRFTDTAKREHQKEQLLNRLLQEENMKQQP